MAGSTIGHMKDDSEVKKLAQTIALNMNASQMLPCMILTLNLQTMLSSITLLCLPFA